MSLERTLALLSSPSTRTIFFSPLANTKIPTLSLKPSSSNSKKPHSKRILKCTADYGFNHYSQAAACSKPAGIQWSKELCNSVHLIGIVGSPVEIKHLPSGKVVAWTRLAVKKSATDTSWINLTFWDELAQIAFQHVEKGHQIYVSGRLISDSVENDDGKMQTFYKVTVRQLNFVERSSPTEVSHAHNFNNLGAGRKLDNAPNDLGSVEERWQAFFANPLEWWDNRQDKVWLKESCYYLIAKRNPKYPDFKHKDTGEALWVEGRYNPPWVKSQLAILDERMGSIHDRDSRLHLNLMSGDDLMPLL